MFYSSKPTAFMCAVMCGALLGYLTTSASADGVKTPERIKSAGKIVFCTDVGFPPWEMYDPNTQQPTGFDVDMAAAVSKEMGVKSEHKNIGFDGLIPALLANQCDAIISGFYDKPERAKVVDFADYAKTGSSIIVKADSKLDAKTLQDFSGKKVAVGIGTAGETTMNEVNEALKAAGKDEIKVVAVQTSAEAFQQLMVGLVDGYLGSTDQAGYYNKQQPGSVRLQGDVVVAFPTGIATRPNDKELHEAFAQAIKAIQANGTYDGILKNWGFEALALR